MRVPEQQRRSHEQLRIGAVLITRNEERNLQRCLPGLAWVDEIVVVDDCSSDRTVEVAKRFGGHVIEHPLENFSSQRNIGLDAATADWILHIDADEECTPELAQEIRAAIASGAAAGFTMEIRNRFLGRVMRGREWTHHRRVRLARREVSRWRRHIHEKLEVTGPIGDLRNCIEHHGERDYTQRVTKSNRYTSFEAERLEQRGVRFTLWRLLFVPCLRAMKSLTLDGGWRDGLRGIIWAGHVWWGNFAVYVKLWDRERLRRESTQVSVHPEKPSRERNVAGAAR